MNITPRFGSTNLPSSSGARGRSPPSCHVSLIGGWFPRAGEIVENLAAMRRDLVVGRPDPDRLGPGWRRQIEGPRRRIEIVTAKVAHRRATELPEVAPRHRMIG